MSVLIGGSITPLDDDVLEVAVVVELAVAVPSSSPRSSNQVTTPAPTRTTTTATMIHGSALFLGGCP